MLSHLLELYSVAGDIILDENALVSSLKCSYLDLGGLKPSPSHKLMAYSLDTSGYETYNIHFQKFPESDSKAAPDTISGESLGGIDGCFEMLTETGGDIVWWVVD